MTWRRFWELVEVLGGRATREDCDRLREVLARQPVEEIAGFGERLAEALYRLDQEAFGVLPVAGLTRSDGSPMPQSYDSFLYSRAAVVAAGRETYESVFGHPERFAPFTTVQGEWLLYAHEEAYERVTGRRWDRVTRYSYESCTNPDGWPGRDPSSTWRTA